ncbi:IQ domain-containing protein IQM2, partial [Cucurbita argyrosperma subsp. argyrosperma]
MGAFFSCPLAKHIGVGNGVESGRTALESSVSFKGKDLKKITEEEELHIVVNSPKSEGMENRSPRAESRDGIQMIMDLGPTNREHMAATQLQRVYKSFRTRRRLADCAVLAEKSWWTLLNFAELRRSSVSFFDIEKHKTAVSRWSRARTRAARVGKGLSKNEKAQMLALQHWLEAIDPRHRYGQNLQLLDIGEGKELDLVEECPRVKLQQQCIKYLGPLERTAYEVVVKDGKFVYKRSGELVHTTRVDKHEKWIFVLSTSKVLYVGKKMKGTFHHSKNNVDLTHVKMNPDDEKDNVEQTRTSSSSKESSAGLDDGTVAIVAEEMSIDKPDSPEQEPLLTGSCKVEIIPDESILKRINSHKETKSYQLGKQLSCKWTTGAGPRIGCVRDYPVKLQLRALEKPRKATARSKFRSSPPVSRTLSSKVSNQVL